MPTIAAVTQFSGDLIDVAVIWLVTITADDGVNPPTTIRLARNYTPVVSRGEIYLPYPHMEVGRPDDAEDRPPSRAIVIEDVGREVVAALRSLRPDSPPEITIELILEDALDTVQDSWSGTIREAGYDATSIEAEIRTDALIGTGAPRVTRTPSTHPAMFADAG